MEKIECQRIHFYDIAKGFALILMLIGHSELPYFLQILNQIIFVFHMPLFFMVSGMLTLPNMRFDVRKKTYKILFPYLIVFVLSILPYFHRYGNLDIVPIFLFMKTRALFGWENGGGIGPIWFLPAYFFTNYIIFKAKKCMSLNTLFLISFVVYSVLLFFAKNIGLPFLIYQISLGVVFVLLGYYMKQVELFQKKLLVLVGFASTVLCIKYGSFSMYSCVCKLWVFQIIAAVFCTMVILECAKRVCKEPILEWISRHSLKILCIHSFDWNFDISLKAMSYLSLPIYYQFLFYCVFIFAAFLAIQILKYILSKFHLAIIENY